MKVDLAEGRRLLDAHLTADRTLDQADAWWDWCDNNAEAMLTLLERTRTALHDLKQDHHEIRDCTCGTCEVAYQVWNVLTATDTEVKDEGDPLSLLEPENLP